MAVTVAVFHHIYTGLEMCVCVCVCEFVCVWFMEVQRGQPSPDWEPPMLERDGWGGGAKDSDLHLLIELSPVSCHKPVIEHRLDIPSFIMAQRLRMMGYEVFWIKPNHLDMT